MLGLEVVFGWIEKGFDYIIPFDVIPYYDKGVRLRFGVPSDQLKRKWLRTKNSILEPGFHWKIPFVDRLDTHMVKTTTLRLSEQTITTKDFQSIVVETVIKYKVSNVRTLLLEVDNPTAALSDTTQGIIRDKMMEKNWDECNTKKIEGEISGLAKRRASEWGIEIIDITFPTLALMRSIRLLTNGSIAKINEQ